MADVYSQHPKIQTFCFSLHFRNKFLLRVELGISVKFLENSFHKNALWLWGPNEDFSG